MKKVMCLSLAVILESICSDAEAMGALIVETAKVVSSELAKPVAERTIDVSNVNMDILMSVPEAMKEIPPEGEAAIIEEKVKRECFTGNWADQSIEGLLSLVLTANPGKGTALVPANAYQAGTVGETFSKVTILKYGLGTGTVFGMMSTSDEVLAALEAFDKTKGIRVIGNKDTTAQTTITTNVTATADAVDATLLDIALQKVPYNATPDYVPVTSLSVVNANSAIADAAVAAVAAVLKDAAATAATIQSDILTAAKNSLEEKVAAGGAHDDIRDAVATAIQGAIWTAIDAGGAANVDFNAVKTTEAITNVHLLHLLGAMSAVAKGLGVPNVDGAAAAEDNPLIAATSVANRVALLTYDADSEKADAQKRSAAQYLLTLAAACED